MTISGSGFTGVTQVKFGSTPASFTFNSDTSITTTSPAGTAGAVDITVTTAAGTSSTSAADQFTYVAAPTVTSVSPNSGSMAGGTSVMITGTNFTSGSQVSFGGTSATSVTLNSSTLLIATSPASSAGTFDVTVTTAGGTSATSAADHFNYYVVTPSITTALPNPVFAQAYSQTLAATGGTSPYTFALTSGALPTGLSLSSAGVLSGTPTANGTFTFTITVTDSTSGTAITGSRSYSLQVTGTPSSSAVTVQTAANTPVTFNATAQATGGPFTGITISTPPASGTAVVSGDNITYTPTTTTVGNVTFAYTLTNATGTSTPIGVTVVVGARNNPALDPDVTGLIGAQVATTQRFATTQINNYNQRLEALHGDGRAPSSNGLNVALPAQQQAGVDTSHCQDLIGITQRSACVQGKTSGVSTGDGTAPNLPGIAAGEDKRLAFWSAGTLDFGFANAAAQRAGLRFTTGGVTFGADYRLSDQLSFGAGFGYAHDSTDVGSDGTRSTGDSYNGALYASYRPAPTLFVDAIAGFGTLSFDSRRWVSDVSDFATGKRNGQQFFGSLTAGYEYRANGWLLSPYGRLSASRSTLDQYSETGAGLDALTYFKQDVNTISGTLGARAAFAMATRLGMLSPYLRVELQHDFNGQSVAGLAYADLASSGPAYYVSGTPYSSTRVQIGVGAKLQTGPLIFGLDYSVTTGASDFQQGVRLTVTMPF